MRWSQLVRRDAPLAAGGVQVQCFEIGGCGAQRARREAVNIEPLIFGFPVVDDVLMGGDPVAGETVRGSVAWAVL